MWPQTHGLDRPFQHLRGTPVSLACKTALVRLAGACIGAGADIPAPRRPEAALAALLARELMQQPAEAARAMRALAA